MNNVVKVVISHDEFFNPRDCDNLGTMICFHRRYSLGDNHKLSVHEAMKLSNSKNLIELPLYLYDHSGITMATTPFSCPWDSGKVGFIYVTKEKVREWYGVKLITKKVRERVLKALQAEVKEYDAYLRGDVYDYVAYDESGDAVDSCGGYVGDIEKAKDAARHMYANAEIVIQH